MSDNWRYEQVDLPAIDAEIQREVFKRLDEGWLLNDKQQHSERQTGRGGPVTLTFRRAKLSPVGDAVDDWLTPV